jgi:deazaflavin-dependent oxidoreductase (nitroreductase family)
MSDPNELVIAEFRSNGGRVGGDFEGARLLLLNHLGARSGRERVTPLMYRKDHDSWVVFASKAGAPDNPDWYHNVRAHPEVTIEVGDRTVAVDARVADASDRDRLWEAQKLEVPQFAMYEESTTRRIPVVILDPR